MKTTGAFQVVTDTYVTEDSGTGIVHSAPAFGEVRIFSSVMLTKEGYKNNFNKVLYSLNSQHRRKRFSGL